MQYTGLYILAERMCGPFLVEAIMELMSITNILLIIILVLVIVVLVKRI